ncbi:MAG TPA: sulfatase [Candidatus Lokiarchaeia archaeon]|nr:sulfatase [Candidatus Lokiarchaeia archaeon]
MTGNNPMNFIIVISDTLRRDFLSCYGDEKVDTRNIKAFADKNIVFDNAYSASFPTVPHRRDVFTGCYTATYTPWAPMTMEPTIQMLLGQNGYTSMMICDEPHILENGYHYDKDFDGFEWIRGQEHDRWKTSPKKPAFKSDTNLYRMPELLQKTHMRQRALWRHESDTFPARTSTCACDWLEENYNEGPFYLYVDFFDPHEPWDAPEWLIKKYADPAFEGNDIDYPKYSKTEGYLTDAEIKNCRARYAAEVTLIDRWAGRIFQKIDDLGLLDNTVVFFTTDHGFLLGEHGFIGKSLTNYNREGKYSLSYLPLFEEINHIPLIVHYPGIEPGRRQALVQPPDFFPTIMDIQGHPFAAVHGRSFKNVLVGEMDQHREFTTSFPYLQGSGVPITFVKDGWSAVFVSKALPAASSVMVDKAVDGLEKALEPWEDARDSLFDLEADPHQLNNVAADHHEEMAQFKQMLIKFLDQLGTEDELLDGWKNKDE